MKVPDEMMLELAAEALWLHAGFGPLHPEGFAQRPERIRRVYLDEARAVLSALGVK